MACEAGCSPKPIVSSGRLFPLCPSRRLPAIPGAFSGKKQPVTGQPKGKSSPEGRASEPGRTHAAKPRRCRGKGKGEEKETHEGGVLKVAKGKTFHSCGVQTLPPPPLIAIVSPSSSEASPVEVPLYDTSYLMPPVDEGSRRCYYQKRRSGLPRTQWPRPEGSALGVPGAEGAAPPEVAKQVCDSNLCGSGCYFIAEMQS